MFGVLEIVDRIIHQFCKIKIVSIQLCSKSLLGFRRMVSVISLFTPNGSRIGQFVDFEESSKHILHSSKIRVRSCLLRQANARVISAVEQHASRTFYPCRSGQTLSKACP